MRRRARPLQQEAAEARDRDQPGRLPHRAALGADRVKPGLALEARRLRRAVEARRAEPQRPLPAVARAEDGALVCQHGGQGRGLGRAAGRPLLVRRADGVFVLVDLQRLGAGVGGVAVRGEAARIERPEVPLALALGHDVGDGLAGAAALHDAEGEGAAEVEPAQIQARLEGRPDQRVAVRRVGDRAVHHALHAGLAQQRHAADRQLDVALQPLQVVGEELGDEAGRDARVPDRDGAFLLVGPEQQPVALLAQVVGIVRVAQQREFRPRAGQLRQPLGHQVLVLQRDDGQALANQRRHLAGTVARGVDDDLGLDLALRRAEAPAVAVARHGGDRAAAQDRGAQRPRAAGEGLGRLRGVDVAVARIPQAAQQAGGLQRRIAPLQLVGRQHLELEVQRVGDGGDVAVLVEPRRPLRQADRAGDVVVDGAAGQRAQLAVEPRRVALQVEQRPGGGEVRAVAGGVPGRAGGQLVALQQQQVGPALTGEMPQGRAADDAATDDHRAGVTHTANPLADFPPLPWRERVASDASRVRGVGRCRCLPIAPTPLTRHASLRSRGTLSREGRGEVSHVPRSATGAQSTSSIFAAPTAHITRRSTPSAMPAAGGMVSSAARKSSSSG